MKIVQTPEGARQEILATVNEVRLLHAFRVMDHEDMRIILGYVEYMAENRSSERQPESTRRPALRVVKGGSS